MKEVKTLFVAIIALITGLILLRFIAKNTINPKAVAPNVTLTMDKTNTQLSPGQQTDVTVTINTDTSTNKISALDLTFQTVGNVQLVAATAPVNAANNDGTVFTELVKQVSAASAKLSYISIKSNDQLPSSVTFKLTVKNDGSSTGTGTLSLSTTASKVTGTIAENTYTWGSVAQSQFTTGSGGGGGGGGGSDVVDVSMTPSSGYIQSGYQQNVLVQVKARTPTNKISALDLQFQATGSITIIDATTFSDAATGDTTIFDPVQRAIGPTQTRLTYTSIKPDHQLPNAVNVSITIRNSSGSTAPGTFSLVIGGSRVVGNITSNTYGWGTVVSGAYNGATVTNQPTPTTGQSTPTNTPPSGQTPTIGSCQTPAATSSLQPNGVLLDGAGVRLSWNAVSGATSYTLKVVDDANSGYTPEQTVTINNITSTTYTYTFTPMHFYQWYVSATNACGQTGPSSFAYAYIYGDEPTPTTTATPTPTPLVDPNATPTPQLINIALKVHLQGVNTQPAKSPPNSFFTLTLHNNADRDRDRLIKLNYQMTYIGKGVWRGVQQVYLQPSEGWTFFVEGEKHLRRRICDARPTDHFPGSYHCANGWGNITINGGDNEFDFSRLTMFTGDVPFKGENDGVIDSYDISFLRTHLGTVSGDAAYVGDLNYDGRVDSQDYTLAITGMLIQRSDE